MKKIVWLDLPKPQGMFTNRSTVMLDLTSAKIVQHYSANTKIEVKQYACVNGDVYFRTASAAERGLDWGFSAKSFGSPIAGFASLAPICVINQSDTVSSPVKQAPRKQKSRAKTSAPKSEVEQARKEKLLNRLFNHFKKGKK